MRVTENQQRRVGSVEHRPPGPEREARVGDIVIEIGESEDFGDTPVCRLACVRDLASVRRLENCIHTVLERFILFYSRAPHMRIYGSPLPQNFSPHANKPDAAGTTTSSSSGSYRVSTSSSASLRSALLKTEPAPRALPTAVVTGLSPSPGASRPKRRSALRGGSSRLALWTSFIRPSSCQSWGTARSRQS